MTSREEEREATSEDQDWRDRLVQVEPARADSPPEPEVRAEVTPMSVIDSIPESLRSAVGAEVAIVEREDLDPSFARTDPGETLEIRGAAPFPKSAEPRPSYLFFGIVAALSLIADISTKVWAELVINQRGFEPVRIIGENVSITLAYNQGGAWGLFSGADEVIRKPFFIGVSGFAVFFIISLYSRLHGSQIALKWGLPLVLGGALGNLSDRITRSQVIDFIDYRADWVMSLNSFVKQYVSTWTLTDHWPTFNVADVAICIGVGLMAVDMFTHRPRAPQKEQPSSGGSSSGEDFGEASLFSGASETDDSTASPGAPGDASQGPTASASVAS
jgi:signal peptidase II